MSTVTFANQHQIQSTVEPDDGNVIGSAGLPLAAFLTQSFMFPLPCDLAFNVTFNLIWKALGGLCSFPHYTLI